MLNSSHGANRFQQFILLSIASVFFMKAVIASEVCDDSLVQSAIKSYELIGTEPFFHVACERIVGSATEVVIAVSQRQPTDGWDDGSGMGPYGLRIALVDTRSNLLRASANFPNRFFSDGEGFRGIQVVFLKDQISRSFRSFGINASYSTVRFGSETLSLYIVNDSQIEEVLTDFKTKIFVAHFGRECRGRSQYLASNIKVVASKSTALKPLRVTDTVSIRKFKATSILDCNDSLEKSERRTFTLRSKASKYDVPNPEKRFRCEVC
jgi:hypothetical protein